MNGVDDNHTDPDHAGAMAAPPERTEVTDEQFAAAAAAHDARALATAMPGVVVVHTNLEDFVRTVQARQLEKARRDADPRTADQMAPTSASCCNGSTTPAGTAVPMT